MATVLAAFVPALSMVAEQSHLVRKGETLTGVARAYGLAVGELAKANDLTTKSKIRIGQRLTIPSRGSNPLIDAGQRRSFDRATVKPGRWRHVVVHHSATNNGTVRGMDQYHSEELHMENGLAYHFVIGNGKGMLDGEIVAGRRWLDQLAGGHLRSEDLNQISLGICLVGNFEVHEPTARQMRSLAAVINYLLKRCRLARTAVKTHQQINTVFTLCPGRHFQIAELLKLVG